MDVQGDQRLQMEGGILNGLVSRIDDLQKAADEELVRGNEIYGDLFGKIKVFRDKMDKTDFILEWEIFNDLFNLMEKHLADEDLSVLKRGLNLFIHETEDTEPDNVDPDHVLRTAPEYSKNLFYMFFNLCRTRVIQNYFKNIEIPDHLKSVYRPCISRILLVMAYTCKISDLGLNDPQRPTYCLEVLSSMLNYVHTMFKSSDLTSSAWSTDEIMVNRCILSFMLWYGDKTILIPDLMNIGCSAIMVDILSRICKTPEIHTELRLFVVVVIYNISRHDDGVKQLNNLHTSDVIKAFESSNHNMKIDIACYTTLVLLATPEQIKNDRKCMNNILDKLLEKVYDASISSDHRADREFHLSELFIVFVKLFNDDRALEYIMEQSKVDLHTSSTTEFFINQLLNHYFEISDEDPLKQATCTALVNILWSVSFQEKHKQKLKDAGTRFKQLIQNLTKQTQQKSSPNQYVPQYIESIQKAATGLLFNIDELIRPTGRTPAMVGKNQKPMIMISYSHKDSEFCKQLYNEISQRGHEIWIDFKFLKTGDLWEQIAAGMKRAHVIVCLMSEDYCQSKSCRWEATYSLDKLQTTKSIIPVFLREYQLPDWLEIRTSMLKYVRFCDLKAMEDEKLLELIEMIEYSLLDLTESSAIQMIQIDRKPILHSSRSENQDISSKNDPVLHTTIDHTRSSKKPIEQWDQHDISQWFQQNNILTELRDLCRFQDGYELLDYAEILQQTKIHQYQLYSNEFLKPDGVTLGQRPLLLHEFTKFSNALRKLKHNK